MPYAPMFAGIASVPLAVGWFAAMRAKNGRQQFGFFLMAPAMLIYLAVGVTALIGADSVASLALAMTLPFVDVGALMLGSQVTECGEETVFLPNVAVFLSGMSPRSTHRN